MQYNMLALKIFVISHLVLAVSIKPHFAAVCKLVLVCCFQLTVKWFLLHLSYSQVFQNTSSLSAWIFWLYGFRKFNAFFQISGCGIALTDDAYQTSGNSRYLRAQSEALMLMSVEVHRCISAKFNCSPKGITLS